MIFLVFPKVKVTSLCAMQTTPRYVCVELEWILCRGDELNARTRIHATDPVASTKSNTYRFPFHVGPNRQDLEFNRQLVKDFQKGVVHLKLEVPATTRKSVQNLLQTDFIMSGIRNCNSPGNQKCLPRAVVVIYQYSVSYATHLQCDRNMHICGVL